MFPGSIPITGINHRQIRHKGIPRPCRVHTSLSHDEQTTNERCDSQISNAQFLTLYEWSIVFEEECLDLFDTGQESGSGRFVRLVEESSEMWGDDLIVSLCESSKAWSTIQAHEA